MVLTTSLHDKTAPEVAATGRCYVYDVVLVAQLLWYMVVHLLIYAVELSSR